jgi:hypothetical protein
MPKAAVTPNTMETTVIASAIRYLETRNSTFKRKTQNTQITPLDF